MVEIRDTMKYGLVNGVKTIAIPKQEGYCPICGGPLVSKCGNTKVHHWAHKNTKECDSFWERETQWHRDWKNLFPVDWQEIVHKDLTGEKHIADIKTPHGLVVEFQHSHITTKERDSRETFYEHMIWVVDGTRRKTDLEKFNTGAQYFKRSKMNNVYFVPYPEEVLSKDWLGGREIVILDFNGESKDPIQKLFMFWRPGGKPQMQCMTLLKHNLIELIRSGDLLTVLKE